MSETQASPAPPTEDFSWHVASRLGEIEGEARANTLRALGILLFYGVELLAYHGGSIFGWDITAARPEAEHRAISLLAGAWALMAVSVQALLRRRFCPPLLKFATTAGDLVLLTALLAVSEGARSPFLVTYFLVLGLAGLRLNLPLVRFATAGAGASWIVLLGIARFTNAPTPARYHQVMVLLAILLAGVMLGQAVRRSRKVAEEYAERRGPATPPPR